MASWYQIHHRLWFFCDSFFTWIVLRSFRHHFRTIGRTEMANVKQTQEKIPFITCEISLGPVCLRVGFWCQCIWFGFWSPIQVDSIKQPIMSNSVGSGNMSHCRTPSLYNHLDHCFVVFKHIQQSFLMRRIDVWGNKINIVQIIDPWDCFRFWIVWGGERTSRLFFNRSPALFCLILIRVPKDCNDQIP